MRLTVFLFGLILILSTNSVQGGTTDLHKSANNWNQADSLYYQFWKNLDVDLLEAEKNAELLLGIAEELNDPINLLQAYDCLGQLDLVRKEYNKAKIYIEKIRRLSKGEDKEYSQYYYALGKVYYYQENLDSALYFWDKALAFFESQKRNKYITETKLNIGASLQQQRIEEGLAKSDTDYEALLDELSRIGVVYLDLADYRKSEHYFKKALSISEKHTDEEMKSELLFQMGDVSFYQGSYSKAISLYQESMSVKKKLGLAEGVNNLKIGRAYIKLGRFDEAEEVLLKAIEQLSNSDDKLTLIDAISYLSGLYYRMNLPDKALLYFGMLENTYDTFEEGEVFSDFNRRIIESSFLVKDSVKGHFFTSLREQETINEIYDIESDFQIAKKENEILLLKQEELIVKRNNQLLWLMIVLAIIVIILIVLQNHNLKQKKILTDIRNRYKDLQIQKTRLALSKKNEDFKNMADNLTELKQNFDSKNLNILLKELKRSSIVEKNWEDYLKTYEEMNPAFFAFLEIQGIHLTFSEKRLCAMVHQGLTIGAIAHMLNNQKKSVESARYRLRKKLDLNERDNLLEYIEKNS